LDKEAQEEIIRDLEEISDSFWLYEKIENLVSIKIPLLLEEIRRFQELETLVYRLLFVEMKESENKTLQGELVQFFKNQVEWPDDDEDDSSEESEEQYDE